MKYTAAVTIIALLANFSPALAENDKKEEDYKHYAGHETQKDKVSNDHSYGIAEAPAVKSAVLLTNGTPIDTVLPSYGTAVVPAVESGVIYAEPTLADVAPVVDYPTPSGETYAEPTLTDVAPVVDYPTPSGEPLAEPTLTDVAPVVDY